MPIGCRVRMVEGGGNPVPDGQPGELQVASDRLMSGYLNDPERTAAALRDGWYATGDLARRNPDGSIGLVGRIGEAIKDVRGEWLHPAEVERLLESHPGVVEAGICGLRDGEGAERLEAGIVPQDPDSFADLRRELRDLILSRLGSSRLPARLHLLTALPRNTHGKLDRRRLAMHLGQNVPSSEGSGHAGLA